MEARKTFSMGQVLAAISAGSFDGQQWFEPEHEYAEVLGEHVLRHFAASAICAALDQTAEAVKVALHLAAGVKINNKRDLLKLETEEYRERGVFLFCKKEQQREVQNMVNLVEDLENFYEAHHIDEMDVHGMVYLALTLDTPAREVFRRGLLQNVMETDTPVKK